MRSAASSVFELAARRRRAPGRRATSCARDRRRVRLRRAACWPRRAAAGSARRWQPLGPKPIIQIGARARILIASQAPGRRAHETGVPCRSRGRRRPPLARAGPRRLLRPEVVAIRRSACAIPAVDRAAICRRGRSARRAGTSVCAPSCRPYVSLSGRAPRPGASSRGALPTLSATVGAFRAYLPDHFPLPPSPRNRPWLLRHPWFERDVLPALRAEVGRALW